MAFRRGIEAFDFCVVGAMWTIDECMRLVPGFLWKPIIHDGLNWEILLHEIHSNVEDVRVRIRPTSWPKSSSVVLRVIRQNGGWDVEEGSINLFYPEGVDIRASFRYHGGNPSFILAEGTDLNEELIASLKKRVGKSRAEAILRANGVTS